MQEGGFKNLRCSNISRQNNNFINLANKYNNVDEKVTRVFNIFQLLSEILIGT